MRPTRVLLAICVIVAVAFVPTAPAAAADQITWPEVVSAAQAAQTLVIQGGGTITVEVSGKISYRRVTDVQPGGAVIRERYREAGMSDAEADDVTWTITRKGVATRYQPMPPLPKTGRYPTLRNVSWVRLGPPATTDVTPPLQILTIVDPLGDIASGPANDAGIISASWTHGIEGRPDSAVTATFTRTAPGALVLRSFSITALASTGPGSDQTADVDFANPRLVVPDVGSSLPEDYVDAAMDAARDTTSAFYSVRNAASRAREKAAVMTRAQLISYLRSQVGVWQDFSHPPDDPSTDIIANVPGGVRLTNPNAYSGRSTIWTVTVTADKQVVVTKRSKQSKVVPAPANQR